jgi:hypothetical protein
VNAETEQTPGWVLGTHLGWTLLGALLLVLQPVETRLILWAWVIAYNLWLPLFFGRVRPDSTLFDLWRFLLPLSLLQIAPDWFLCTVLQTLEFPARAGPAPVPGYMGGLWTMPLLLACWVGLQAGRRYGARGGYLACAAAGLLVFGAGEWALTKIPVWRALDVQTTAGVAWYILPAELLLSVAALGAYKKTSGQTPGRRLTAGFAVMLFYIGAAGFSYMAIELWLLG